MPAPEQIYDDNCKVSNRSKATPHGPVWESCDHEKSHGIFGQICFVFLYIIITMILFVAMAIICDDFFVPSLEAISEALNLPEDVAGATFMAAGSSAPELFSSIAAVTFQSDVGVGTITGSAVFNLLVIVALTAAFSEKLLCLDWRPLIRDSVFYAVSIAFFISAVWDSFITAWESCVFLTLYCLYIVTMIFNGKVMDLMTYGGQKCCAPVITPVDTTDDDEQTQTLHASLSYTETGGQCSFNITRSLTQNTDQRKPSVFSSQSSTASNESKLYRHNKQNSLIQSILSPGLMSHVRTTECKFTPPERRKTQARPSVYRRSMYRKESRCVSSMFLRNVTTMTQVQFKTSSENSRFTKELSSVDSEPATIDCPCGWCPPIRGAPPQQTVRYRPSIWQTIQDKIFFVFKWILFVMAFPFIVAFSYTIPDCSKPHNRKYYLVSFFTSVMWIAALSFGMVTVVARTGCLIKVDSFVMSLVFLAAGTSIPDLLSSIIVARDGFGDMAVSNAIGSNVFDINLGLGLPFLIRIIVQEGKPFSVFSAVERAAYCKNEMVLLPHPKFGFLLLFILIAALLVISTNRFQLNRKIGLSFFLAYLLFLTYAFIQEFLCGYRYNC